MVKTLRSRRLLASATKNASNEEQEYVVVNSSSNHTTEIDAETTGVNVPVDSTVRTHAANSSTISQLEEPTQNTNSENRSKRGRTRGKGLKKINKAAGKKLKVHIDIEQGRPVDRVQSAKLSNQLGFISCECIPIPKKWSDVKNGALNLAMDHLEMQLDIANGNDKNTQEKIEQLLKTRMRKARYALKQNFLKFDSVEDAKKNKPDYENLTQEHWEDLCNFWDDPKVKERSAKNTANRSKLQTHHNQGSTAFVVVRNEMEEKLDEKEEFDRIAFNKLTHFTEGKGWTTPEAESQYNKMMDLLHKSQEDGQNLSSDEICDRVLGTRSGYIKGLGYGPKPKSKGNSSNVKITRLEEELKQKDGIIDNLSDKVDDLKNRLENQEKAWEARFQRQEKMLDLVLSGRNHSTT